MKKKEKLVVICLTTLSIQCMLVDMHMLYPITGLYFINDFDTIMGM